MYASFDFLANETPFLTEEKLNKIIDDCESEDNWSYLIRTIGACFNNPDALVQSFRKPTESPTKEEIRSMEIDMDKDKDEREDEAPMSEECVASSSVASCSKVANKCLKEDEVTVDIDSVRRSYARLFAIPGHPFQGALINALSYLSRTIEMELRYHNAYNRDPNYLNIFLIVMEIPTLHSPEFIKSATPFFCKALGRLPIVAQAKLARVWSSYHVERLKGFVECLQQMITVKVVSNEWNHRHGVNDDEAITNAARVLKVLYYSSILGGTMDPHSVLEEERLINKSTEENLQDLLQGAVGHEAKDKTPPKQDPLEKELNVSPLDCQQPMIPWEDFVNEPLSEQIEMDRDYTNYKATGNEPDSKFSFMTHSFLLTTAVKNLGMYFDNRIRMMEERRASLLQTLMHGAPTMPYLRLRIRRDHIIDDALVAVSMV